jgi:hypothetical protein
VETNPNWAKIVEDAKEYVLYSWSVQDAINPIAVAGAEGRHFWDYDGKRYLDFASQLVNVNIGHQHPKLVAAIQEQAEQLATIGPPMASESRSRLGCLLAEVTPGDLTMSFFTNGGAEANENAIKLARMYTGRHKIIARYRSCTVRRNISCSPATRHDGRTAGHGRRRADARPVHRRHPAGRIRVSVRNAPPREILGTAAHGLHSHPWRQSRHERDHPAAARLPPGGPRSATGTGSCSCSTR